MSRGKFLLLLMVAGLFGIWGCSQGAGNSANAAERSDHSSVDSVTLRNNCSSEVCGLRRAISREAKHNDAQ